MNISVLSSDKLFGEVLAQFLRHEGNAVREFSAPQALMLSLAYLAPPDACVLYLDKDADNVTDAIRGIREAAPMPILVYTSHIDEEQIEHAGGIFVAYKNNDPDALILALRELGTGAHRLHLKNIEKG